MPFKSVINNATANQAGAVTTAADFLIRTPGVADLLGGHLVVTATGANMNVSVAAGEALVLLNSYAAGAGNQKYVPAFNSSAASATVTTAHVTNPRIDLVCLKIDTGAVAGAQGAGAVSVVVVAGTAAASPTAPALPANHLLLAEVAVAAGASTINNGNITDKRRQLRVVPPYLRDGEMANGQIVRTVASNALTVALKTEGGNDPSTSDPVWIKIDNTMYQVTAALSLTLSSGTGFFSASSTSLAANPIDYFVYLGYRAASNTVFIALSRYSRGRVYSYFSGTNTNQKYLAFSGSTPASTDKVAVIGRVNATLSAGNNWSVPASSDVTTGPIYTTSDLSYTVIPTGWSGTPTVVGNYTFRDDIVELDASITGTSNSTTTTGSVPFTNNSTRNQFGSGYAVSGGADTLALYTLATSASTFGGNTVTTTTSSNPVGNGSFSNSGTKQVYVHFTYRPA